MNIKKLPRKLIVSAFYLTNSLLVPGINFLSGLLIAIYLGPIIRGEFTYLFSIMSLVMVVFFGFHSSLVKINTSKALFSISDEQIAALCIRSFFGASVILFIPLIIGKIGIVDLTFLSIGIVSYGGLILKQQQFLAAKMKRSAFWITGSVWIAYSVIICILIIVNSPYVSPTFFISILAILNLVVLTYSLRHIQPCLRPKRELHQYSSFEKLSLRFQSFATVVQTNGIIIILELCTSPKELGIISVSFSILNALLIAGQSLIGQQLWEGAYYSNKLNTYLWFGLSLIFMVLALAITELMPAVYERSFVYFLVFLPIYSLYYFQEIAIVKGYRTDKFKKAITNKFIFSTSYLLSCLLAFKYFVLLTPGRVLVLNLLCCALFACFSLMLVRIRRK